MMKTISLREVCQLLNRSGVVEIADHKISLSPIEFSNESEKEFLRLEWSDDGIDFDVSFAVKDNRSVDFDGDSLYLISTFGDTEVVKLL